MPPANSPNETPPHASEAASPYLEQLELISSPVPDFAATLLTSVRGSEMESGRHEPPSRTRFRHPRTTSLSRSNPGRQPYLTEDEFGHFTSESRRRMQRTIEANRHAPTAQSYSNRTPRQQSLYDWAVSESDEGELEPRQQQGPSRSPPLPEQPPAMDDHDGWRDLEEALSTQRRRRNQTRREPRDEPSGRATFPFWAEDPQNASRRRVPWLNSEVAIMDAMERRRRGDRIWNAMEGVMLERDRGNHASESTSALYSTLHPSEKIKERPSFLRVRNMIEYLSRVRHCDHPNLDDTVALAMELDVAKCIEGNDLVAETRSIPAPPPTSFLAPGSTFTGSQHAPQDVGGSHMLYRDRDYLRRVVANRNLSSAHLPGSIATLADAERFLMDHRPYLSSRHHLSTSLSSGSRPRAPDHWPVSVTLHSIDEANLTLTGTMSANHIPDKLSPNSPDHKPEGSSMKSYFEGEIIDMNKHTLETETYRAEGVAVDVETDVEYWRQLGPFREACAQFQNSKAVDVESEFHLAACLGSREWVKEVLGKQWVLMRWKERCFLPPSDNNSWGLTISGFYYIALKRDSGRIEGLYYDPGSQPYQRLDLVPEGSRPIQILEPDADVSKATEAGGVKKWFPSAEFR